MCGMVYNLICGRMSEYECVHISHVNYNDNQNYRLVALVQQLTHKTSTTKPKARKKPDVTDCKKCITNNKRFKTVI